MRKEEILPTRDFGMLVPFSNPSRKDMAGSRTPICGHSLELWPYERWAVLIFSGNPVEETMSTIPRSRHEAVYLTRLKGPIISDTSFTAWDSTIKKSSRCLVRTIWVVATEIAVDLRDGG